MGRKLVPWMSAGVAIGLSVLGATAGQTPGDPPNVWVVSADDESGSSRSWLGVSVEEETERQQGGARILQVIPDSPAEEVGLQKGDVIVSVDGKPVYGPRGLSRVLGSHEAGSTVEIAIVRDGQNQALSVELGERPTVRGIFRSIQNPEWSGEDLEQSLEDAGRELRRLEAPGGHVSGFFGIGQRPRLGVRLIEVTPELREHLGGQPDSGVLVGQVMKGMPAEMAGVQVGDLIEAVDGKTIEDVGDLIDAVRNTETGVLRIDIVRDGRAQSIDVVLPDPPERDEPGGPRA